MCTVCNCCRLGPPAQLRRACVQQHVDAALAQAPGGGADYRLGLFRGDGPEEARQGPGVGWGYIAYKTGAADAKVHHVYFRLSHQGFYCRLPTEKHSSLVRRRACACRRRRCACVRGARRWGRSESLCGLYDVAASMRIVRARRCRCVYMSGGQ